MSSHRRDETAPRRCRAGDELGSMAVEMVLLAPIFIMFGLLVVAAGQLVVVRSDIDAAARDAVRAATYERDQGAALAAARAVASSATSADCEPATLSSGFVAGESIKVTLRCDVSLSGLGLIGMPGSLTISGSSSAPLDYYRRTG